MDHPTLFMRVLILSPDPLFSTDLSARLVRDAVTSEVIAAGDLNPDVQAELVIVVAEAALGTALGALQNRHCLIVAVIPPLARRRGTDRDARRRR
jgi:hypothetical protein